MDLIKVVENFLLRYRHLRHVNWTSCGRTDACFIGKYRLALNLCTFPTKLFSDEWRKFNQFGRDKLFYFIDIEYIEPLLSFGLSLKYIYKIIYL